MKKLTIEYVFSTFGVTCQLEGDDFVFLRGKDTIGRIAGAALSPAAKAAIEEGRK